MEKQVKVPLLSKVYYSILKNRNMSYLSVVEDDADQIIASQHQLGLSSDNQEPHWLWTLICSAVKNHFMDIVVYNCNGCKCIDLESGHSFTMKMKDFAGIPRTRLTKPIDSSVSGLWVYHFRFLGTPHPTAFEPDL